MCGIFGYVGESTDVGSAVLGALKTLEYRGYDSWGMALGIEGQLAVTKTPGKISVASVDFPDTDIGFGHTRWATHGGVTEANAHPHLDCTGSIAVIHNGIIENFRVLRAEVEARGHTLRSETDSEVIAHLIEDELAAGRSPQEALSCVFSRLEGLGAVIVLDLASKTMVATKRTSPLVVGRNCSNVTIASDEIALAGHATEIRYLEDGEIVSLGKGGVSVENPAPGVDWVPITVDEKRAGLAGHPDFMSKEMAEQPEVLERLVDRAAEQIDRLADAIRASYGTYMVGCGTASYAALTGSYLFSRIAARHVNFASGSEFKYYEHFLTPESLVIAFSQSGETADIIEAMLAARQRGSLLAGVVNVPRSTLGRMVDLRVDLDAGPEQCVLSTKAYTAKVAVLLMTAHASAGEGRGGGAPGNAGTIVDRPCASDCRTHPGRRASLCDWARAFLPDCARGCTQDQRGLLYSRGGLRSRGTQAWRDCAGAGGNSVCGVCPQRRDVCRQYFRSDGAQGTRGAYHWYWTGQRSGFRCLVADTGRG
jgi:glucosamine--fructose-6-phosphate aminotransferase (isomerizing)